MKKLILLVIVVVVSILSPILGPGAEKVYAATGQVIDRATIRIGERTFFDGDIDDNFNYIEQSPTDRCADIIKGFSNSDLRGTNTPSSATLEIKTPRPNNDDDCDSREESVTFGQSQSNFIKAFAWVDENTIQGADGRMLFTRDGSTNTFNDANSEDRCVDTLRIASDNQTAVLQEREFERNGNHEYDWFPFTISEREKNDSSGCFESDSVSNIQLSGTPSSGNSGGAPSASSGSGDADSCESKGGPMSWILCPVVSLMENVFNWLDDRIQELLIIDDNKYRDENLRSAWANIRNIAYIILVPIMLLMVVSTALGFNFVDAYTVKKAFPRLVAAIIFIALSWELTGLLIQITNDVGRGILGLITAPFDDIGSGVITLGDLFEVSAGGAVLQWAGFIAFFIAATISPFSPAILGVLFSFLLAAALVMATVFFVLVARQIFILVLMLFAPIAILAWIFPGNDKLWGFWWSTFSKLLLMFPMIMAVIGMGRVFGFVIGNADSAGGEGAILNPLLKLVAYVVPYAMIPFTFKFAGGVFGTLTGMINDREKGLFDRLRKGRQGHYERGGRQVALKRADMARNLETSASLNKRTAFGRGIRRGLARSVGGQNMEAAMSARTAQVAKELNEQINTGKDDDIRGLTAAYAYDMAKTNNWDGRTETDYARLEDGKRQYKSLGGAWIDEANVISGRNRWGNDHFAQQAALSYEMRKVEDEGQAQNLAKNYGALTKSWDMSGNEAAGAWIGAAFENQNQHLEYKYTDRSTGSLKSGGQFDTKGYGLVNEIYNKRGSYPLAQMGSNTIEQLKVAHEDAALKGDVETQQKIADIAETFMHQAGVGGRVGGSDDEPEFAPEAAGGARVASTQGSAAVAQRVRELAGIAGVATNNDTGAAGSAPDGYGNYSAESTPTPRRREQK